VRKAVPVIDVPSRYRIPTRGESRVEVGDGTVRECIEAVEIRYPGFQELILDSAGELHRFVKLFVNGDELPRDALDQQVSGTDCVAVLAAAAGG
jgi:adenylyltransferase/sulfurtransferase